MIAAPASSATRIRYVLLAVATANAFLLYLDRICMTAVVSSDSFQKDFGLSKEHVGAVMASFFYAYALGQLPAGWLAGRFGPRRMLVIYILLWSLCTALTGFTFGLTTLIAARLVCGLSEAGAYPASARLIARWFPYDQRARASSAVAFGGRAGNTLALWLTGVAILAFHSWRPVLWIYGSIGIVLALATGITFRDDPNSHPWANDAERNFISSGQPKTHAPIRWFPILELLQHRGLWLLSLGAVGMNFGWGFLITWLPRYLREVRGLGEVDAERYVSIVLFFGMVGMLFGGWWCDALTRWFGPRWGRRLPFLVGCAVAALAYVICPMFSNPIAVVAACALVACAGDSIVPAVWAFCQDVGGDQAAVALGWSNMWGNLGVPVVAQIIPFMLTTRAHFGDWREVFWMCAGGFLLLGFCSLFLDSNQRLVEEPDAPQSLTV